ncbi:LTA synthase family protein [Pseudidiomarina gelatinasegens]|uniref:LTA synthase family protein n=2 Tax=Pseudidiomarina gelatinasegens TaxID=2487740 RepID=A0A451GEU1_9GAMM|nr:LTA synthase family protein [Pseudidiomarina gelatinasegens]
MVRAIKQGTTSFIPVALFVVSSLLMLSLFRFGYFILYTERVIEAINPIEFFLLGIRADLIQIGYYTLVPLLLFPFCNFRKTHQLWLKFSVLWFSACFALLFFMEISTPAFLAQYDTRPNRLFFEYLLYPKEVFSTLWNGFRGWLILGVTASGLVIYTVYTFSKSMHKRLAQRTTHHGMAWLLLPVVLVFTVLGIRSTLAHRPANPAFFAVSSDAMVNSLILNSNYTLAYAVYNLKHEDKANRVYGQLTDAEVIATITAEDHLKSADFPFKNYPTVHFQAASNKREKPLNIVIILEESLGATFVESLGGLPVTPNIERLKNQGWWFENLYATGTRSVRGIEAVVSGFLPSRARSTVKLSDSQRYFFTIADALKRQGYTTEFIYGGESHFDNMAAFFTGNGFSNIIDQDEFSNPVFEGSWGVSDQDLLTMLHARLIEQQGSSQPSFTLAFTSSNHEPFEFPDNQIALSEHPKQTVNNAVKYADHALGQFFDRAMQSDYWQNTLFLVVADHDTRVYGNDLVPIQKFHIPGLILGGDISPRVIDTVTSQIDLTPTLLSLAGVSAYVPTLGQDLSNPETPPANRAMMQFGDSYGWLQGNQLTVLTTDGKQHQFTYQRDSKELLPSHQSLADKQIKRIQAFAMAPSVLYQSHAYYVPVTH